MGDTFSVRIPKAQRVFLVKVAKATDRTRNHITSSAVGKMMENDNFVLAPKGHLKLYIPKTSYFVIFDRTPKDDDIIILAFIHSSRDWEQIDWERMG